MADRICIHRLAIDGAAAEVEGNLHYYNVTMLTNSLNSKNFSIAPDALRSIARQMRTGRTRIFQNHETYKTMPSGRVVNASVRNGQIEGRIYIQAGLTHVTPITDELIEMMDAGTVGEFSPTLSGGRMMCDQSGLQMKQKYTWWPYSFEDADGNRLGQTKSIEGKDTVITATLKGDVKVHELSVVGIAATPDTEVLSKLQAELDDDKIELNELSVMAELGNFNLNEFCTQLSVDPIKLRRDPMPKDKDQDLLERENKQLEKDNAQLQNKVDELELKLDDGFDQEDYDAIVKERDDLKDEKVKLQEKLDGELEDAKDLAEIGRIALKYAREEYVGAEVSLNSLNAEQEAEVAEYVADKTDFLSLMRTAKGYRKRAAQKRSGGAKAKSTYESPPEQEKPVNYSRLGL